MAPFCLRFTGDGCATHRTVRHRTARRSDRPAPAPGSSVRRGFATCPPLRRPPGAGLPRSGRSGVPRRQSPNGIRPACRSVSTLPQPSMLRQMALVGQSQDSARAGDNDPLPGVAPARLFKAPSPRSHRSLPTVTPSWLSPADPASVAVPSSARRPRWELWRVPAPPYPRHRPRRGWESAGRPWLCAGSGQSPGHGRAAG